MPDSLETRTDYQRRLDARRATHAAQERTHARFGHARLVIAGSAIALFLFQGATPWLFVPLLLFAIAALLHARLLNARDRTASAIAWQCGSERPARWSNVAA